MLRQRIRELGAYLLFFLLLSFLLIFVMQNDGLMTRPPGRQPLTNDAFNLHFTNGWRVMPSEMELLHMIIAWTDWPVIHPRTPAPFILSIISYVRSG